MLQELLKTTERVVQEIDSVEYGLTDIQEYYGALFRSTMVRCLHGCTSQVVEAGPCDVEAAYDGLRTAAALQQRVCCSECEQATSIQWVYRRVKGWLLSAMPSHVLYNAHMVGLSLQCVVKQAQPMCARMVIVHQWACAHDAGLQKRPEWTCVHDVAHASSACLRNRNLVADHSLCACAQPTRAR